jgi:phosphoribosylanthranilate isomerase
VTRVKICGITNLDDALAACDAGADALGFVFAEEARRRNRHIAPEEARAIIAQLPPFVTTVAVCVNAPLAELRSFLAFTDLVQLCGEEDPEMYRPVADRALKVIHVGQESKLGDWRNHPARAIVLDTLAPGTHGGSGVPFDWEMARAATELGRPIMLAGGLTPENVAEAVKTVQPYAVDTSGGVEAAPGKKDHDRIRQFIRNARSNLSVS